MGSASSSPQVLSTTAGSRSGPVAEEASIVRRNCRTVRTRRRRNPRRVAVAGHTVENALATPWGQRRLCGKCLREERGLVTGKLRPGGFTV